MYCGRFLRHRTENTYYLLFGERKGHHHKWKFSSLPSMVCYLFVCLLKIVSNQMRNAILLVQKKSVEKKTSIIQNYVFFFSFYILKFFICRTKKKPLTVWPPEFECVGLMFSLSLFFILFRFFPIFSFETQHELAIMYTSRFYGLLIVRNVTILTTNETLNVNQKQNVIVGLTHSLGRSQ